MDGFHDWIVIFADFGLWLLTSGATYKVLRQFGLFWTTRGLGDSRYFVRHQLIQPPRSGNGCRSLGTFQLSSDIFDIWSSAICGEALFDLLIEAFSDHLATDVIAIATKRNPILRPLRGC